MSRIYDFLSRDHRECDKKFARLESAITDKNWEEAGNAINHFIASMSRHFLWEEQILFPALEKESPADRGPTSVMRQEHDVMRRMFENLQHEYKARNGDELESILETMLLFINMHNSKEEAVLYALSDRILTNQVEQLIQEMKKISLAEQ